MKTFIAILISLSSIVAFASSSENLRATGYLTSSLPTPPKRVLLEGGWQGILEQRGSESAYEFQSAWLLRGGLVLKRADIYYEYSKFIDSSGEGSVAIHRTQHMQLAWYRHRLVGAWAKGSFWFLAGGLGMQRENIRTTLGSETVLNDGTYYAMFGASIGGLILIENIIEIGTELRILSSENFRPNPTIGAGITIGIRL